MSQLEKALLKLYSLPKEMRYEELKHILVKRTYIRMVRDVIMEVQNNEE